MSQLLYLQIYIKRYKNLDVDLVPEDDRNIYKCRNQPFHLSVAVDKLNYQYVVFAASDLDDTLVL